MFSVFCVLNQMFKFFWPKEIQLFMKIYWLQIITTQDKFPGILVICKLQNVQKMKYKSIIQ